MSYIIFKNELGELTFSGEGNSEFSLREISGLGTPDKIYQTREYLDFDGHLTISSRFAPRTITIAFDISGKDPSALSARLYRILSKNGTLYTCFENSGRRIEVNQISIDSFIPHGSSYRSFIAQFTCDNPYFMDHSTIYRPCYETVKNLCYDAEADSWHLDTPTIWGANNNDILLVNSGDIKAYPIITLHSSGASDNSNGIELLRVNPQNPEEILQRFSLQYALSDDETIIFSFDQRSKEKRRYISSSLGTNLLNCRSEESSLSDFYLEPGENRLIINNLSTGNVLSASLSYENQYIEGVY